MKKVLLLDQWSLDILHRILVDEFGKCETDSRYGKKVGQILKLVKQVTGTELESDK